MKKRILNLFFIFSLISYAIPDFIDTNKIQKSAYLILEDTKTSFIIGKSTEKIGITVAFLHIANDSPNVKDIREIVIDNAPVFLEHIDTSENSRAYIDKFKEDDNENYVYSFLTKKTKLKNCYISVLYMTDENLENDKLNRIVDKVLNEFEGMLK